MSADEFDPAIERLFAQAPALNDAPLFAAGVETRLNSGARTRALVLTLAGVVGGAVALRETLTVNLGVDEGPVAGRALGQGLVSVQSTVQSALDQAGVGGLEFGSMGAMQLFWIAAGALVALAAAGAVRLTQEV